MEQLDRSFSVSSRDGHGPPVAGRPTPGRESSEIRWPPATELSGRRHRIIWTPATELSGRATGRSMRTHPHQRLPNASRAGRLVERQEPEANYHAVRAELAVG